MAGFKAAVYLVLSVQATGPGCLPVGVEPNRGSEVIVAVVKRKIPHLDLPGIPQSGGKVSKRLGGHRLQIKTEKKLFMAFKLVPRWVVTLLGQQYSTGENPTVMLHCCCIHIKNPSDLYSVPSNIRTGPTDANAFFFRVHSLTTQKGTYYTYIIRQKQTKNIFSVLCFLPIHSGHQVRWTYQPGSHRRKVTQDFPSTFFLRCVP